MAKVKTSKAAARRIAKAKRDQLAKDKKIAENRANVGHLDKSAKPDDKKKKAKK